MANPNTANYVKFLRGTQATWNSLLTKDQNTLYFIYENKDSTSGSLYLGNKLISGGNAGPITGATSLSQLNDVLLANNIADKSLLMYNEAQAKWVNTTLSDVLNSIVSVFTGATAGSNGTSGLVPVPKAGDQDKFLKGDGTWATVVGTLSEDDLKTINDLSSTVTTLVGSDADLSVREIALNVLTESLIPEDAKESLDTLQEIASWIQSHPGDISEINNRLQAVEGSLFDEKATDPETQEEVITKKGLITQVGDLSSTLEVLKDSVDANSLSITNIYDLLEWHELLESEAQD